MTRWTLTALAVMVATLVAVAVSSVRFLRQDHDQRVEQFAEVRRKQIAEAARVIQDDLAAIGKDLGVAGQLVETSRSLSDRQRQLAALLSGSPEYQLFQLYDPAGQRMLSVPSGDSAVAPRAGVDGMMLELAHKVLARTPGEVETTPPVSVSDGGWFRVFATSIAPRPGAAAVGAVAVLVNTEPLFRKLRIVTADPGSTLVVLGTHGRPIPVSSPAVAAAMNTLEEQRTALPALSALRATRPTLGNRAMEHAVEVVCEQVASGKTISEPLEASGVFPPLLVQIVSVGERSGRLPELLRRAADALENRTQASLKLFTAVLPPVLIMIFAGIAGFVIAAILLVVLKIQEMIG